MRRASILLVIGIMATASCGQTARPVNRRTPADANQITQAQLFEAARMIVERPEGASQAAYDERKEEGTRRLVGKRFAVDANVEDVRKASAAGDGNRILYLVEMECPADGKAKITPWRIKATLITADPNWVKVKIGAKCRLGVNILSVVIWGNALYRNGLSSIGGIGLIAADRDISEDEIGRVLRRPAASATTRPAIAPARRS